MHGRRPNDLAPLQGVAEGAHGALQPRRGPELRRDINRPDGLQRGASYALSVPQAPQGSEAGDSGRDLLHLQLLGSQGDTEGSQEGRTKSNDRHGRGTRLGPSRKDFGGYTRPRLHSHRGRRAHISRAMQESPGWRRREQYQGPRP